MRAFILAAGRGERMRPLSKLCPKPLLLLKGQPLISYHLRALAKIGIREIIINVCYLGTMIQDTLQDGSQFGVQIQYSVEDTLLDTGGGIQQALPLLGDDPFLVISADIYTDFPLQTLVNQPSGLAHLVLVDNPRYNLQGDFALQGKCLVLDGLPKYTYGNIGVFRKEFFQDPPERVFPLRVLLDKYIKQQQVTGEYYTGLWNNIGTPAELQQVEDYYVDR